MKRLGIMLMIASFLLLPVVLSIDSILAVIVSIIIIIALFGIGLLFYSIACADEMMLYDKDTDELKPLSDWEQAYLTAIKSKKKESKEREDKKND